MALTGALTPELASKIREVVGANVRRARKRGDLSLRELEVRSGVSRVTLERLERGESEPMVSTLVALSFAFRMPASTLMAGLPQPRRSRTQKKG